MFKIVYIYCLLFDTTIRFWYRQRLLFPKSQKLISATIDYLQQNAQGVLNKKYYVKFKDYAYEALFAFAMFSPLLERKCTKKDEWLVAHLGLIIAIGDTITEKKNVDVAFIKKLKNNKIDVPVLKNEYDVLAYLVLLVCNEIDKESEDRIKTLFYTAFEIEKKQQNLAQDSPNEEILHINNEKGRLSVAIYFLLFNNQLSEKQYNAINKFGSYIDHLDDIFDLNEDLNNGVITYINTRKNWNTIEAFIHSLFKEVVNELIEEFPSNKATKQIVFEFFFFHLGIELYFIQLKKYVPEYDKETIQRLTKKELRFEYFTFRNLFYFLSNISRFKDYYKI